MALITNNISGSIANSSKIGVTGSVIISNDPIFPDFPGTDVVFFVSGSTDGTNKSSFGGDLIVSGAMSIGGDSLEVAGTIAATLGLSGSLTQLVDGTSYLIAGTNITITSASNGAITFDAIATPGGAINEIQYNGGGIFTGSINFTFDGTNACLTGSFSQGNNSKALGSNSHAEGSTTQAIGNESHSEGSGTTTGFLGYLSNDISTSEQDKIYLDSSYGNVVASFSGGQTAIIHDSLYDNSIKYLTASVNGVSWNGTNTVLDFVGVTTIPFTTTAIIGVVGNLTPSGADQIMGQASHAEGSGTLTIGYYSHAEGAATISSGQYSHAEGGSGGGGQLIASGDYSHAEGYNTTASGLASHAEGSGTIAIGDYSHAEGQNTIALDKGAHSEGDATVAIGQYSHSEGENTIARGDYSHAEGLGTIASGSYQHVGGKYNLRNNDYSLYVVGNGTGDDDTLRSDILRVNTDSVQITGSIIQSNSGSSTVGFMGNEVGSSPSSIGSDVFFYVSGSIGSDVAAFGGDLVVSGTILLGGDVLEVTGTISATQGFSGSLTTLVDGTSYLIAGTNITITSASNGSVTIDAAATSPGGSDTEIQYNSGGSFAGSSNFTYNGTTVFLTGSFSQGSATVASGTESHAEGLSTTASGDYSHTEGVYTTASGFGSHSEGNSTTAISDYSHAEGEGTSSGYKGFNTTNITAGVVTLNSSYGDVTTSFNGAGDYALLTWTGEQDIAYEISSVTWNGTNTIVTLVNTSINDTRPGLIGIRGSTLPGSADATTSGVGSHAEGYQTYAQPRYSHAEGYQSLALAVRSHAEGVSTTTIGVGSHSEGLGTIASGSYQHVGGKYNVRNNDFSLFVVGNGTSDADVDRSDVFRINSGSVGDGRVEVTGSLAATMGLSGSLTQLVDGTSYLVAGANVTITSASNGSVTISSAGGSGSPGGSDTEIQYNSAGSFAGSSNFTYNGTTVFLSGSFNQGLQNVVSGLYSHAEGYETLAVGSYSHAEGGTGGGGQLIASGTYSHAEGYNTIAYASGSHAEGWSAKAGALGYHSTSISSGVITLDASYGDLTSTGIGTIVDGTYIVLNDYAYDNNYSSAIYKVDTSVYGTNTVLTLFDLSVSTTEAVIGVAGLATPTAADFPLGQFSHAEGYNTVAMGINSHAEGNGSAASSNFSHAEGEGTNARGIASHAEGASVLSSGDYSHAEGVGSHAFGYASHSEGLETIASGAYQHVGGKFNVRGNDFSLFVVGNGISDADVDRSDVFRINSGSAGDGRVEVTGSLAATMGLSGSLTTLVDGTSYLVAGNNITITSASNGSVTIDATSGASSYYLNFLAGTLSSTAASASMESVGMDYYDVAKVPPGATSYTFKAILATTAGTTAYMDLYDYNGIVTGIPGPISGSVLTGSNQSYTYLTADLTPSLSAVTGSGIFEARIWCDPTGVSLNAICKNATLEIA